VRLRIGFPQLLWGRITEIIFIPSFELKNRESPAWILIFGVGSLFGIMCVVSAVAEWKLVPEGGQVKMAYHELISVLLTGIGVILAALALFIGALAVWGYAQFQSMTRNASTEHLEKMLKDGPFRIEVEGIIIKHVSAQLER
jgi:hypothetical protein